MKKETVIECLTAPRAITYFSSLSLEKGTIQSHPQRLTGMNTRSELIHSSKTPYAFYSFYLSNQYDRKRMSSNRKRLALKRKKLASTFRKPFGNGVKGRPPKRLTSTTEASD